MIVMRKTLHKLLAITLLVLTSSVGAQNLYCSEAPHWKVSSVTRSADENGFVLAIETVDATGTVQVISVSTTSGSTRYVTSTSHVGWTFAIYVQEDDRRRTARVGTQAWCDGRMRGYDEIVLPVLMRGERA